MTMPNISVPFNTCPDPVSGDGEKVLATESASVADEVFTGLMIVFPASALSLDAVIRVEEVELRIEPDIGVGVGVGLQGTSNWDCKGNFNYKSDHCHIFNDGVHKSTNLRSDMFQ
jgi:hypothetical protein